jgi:putative Holliday junction resolvase
VKTGRVLAIDHGQKRSGTAISDTGRSMAFPDRVFRREEDLLGYVRELSDEGRIALVVVGLPLNMDGTEGPRARAVRAFCERVRGATGVPIELWDERLTSVEAAELLAEAGGRRRRGRDIVDAVAAQRILQSYLGGQE